MNPTREKFGKRTNFGLKCPGGLIPDGSLGVKEHFISPYRPGEKITIDEYYQYIFERVPGLPDAAKGEGLTELNYMKKYGAFEVEKTSYQKYLKELKAEQLAGTQVDEKTGTISKNGKNIGVMVDGKAARGLPNAFP